MRNISIALLSILVSLSCKKLDLPTDPLPCTNCPTEETNELEVLWQFPLNKDTVECISMRPFVHKGDVIYSVLFYKDGYEFINKRDGKTGAIEWEWTPDWPGESTSLGKDMIGDNLLVSHWRPKYCIDANTGKNRWSRYINSTEGSAGPDIRVFGDYIYNHHSDAIPFGNVGHLARANIYTGKWDTIFSLPTTIGYHNIFHTSGLWVNHSGDSILVFQNRQWNLPASDGKVDLYTFNLNTKKVEWLAKDIDETGNSSLMSPLIHENKLYFPGEKTLFCYDMNTGKLVWKVKVPLEYDNLLLSNLLIAEGQIFMKPTNDRNLYGLNLQTGQTITQISDAGLGGAKMEYHNGIIYYATDGDGKLYAVKPSTKEVIWRHDPPNRSKPGYGNTYFTVSAICPELNCIFTDDHRFIMAIKLPEQ